MPIDTERKLRMTRRFNATPARVFAAWTTPEVVSQWLFHAPTDEAYTAELDARPGGAFTITARRDGVDYTASGTYLEFSPPHRLVFSFAMPQFSPNSDRITVELAPDGAGCLMTFTQEGVDIAEELRTTEEGQVGGSEQGWIWMFMGLEQALG